MPTLELLRRIDFTRDGNCRQFLGAGCSHPESTHTWILAPLGELQIPVPTTYAGAIIIIHLAPFRRPPALEAFKLEISIDDRIAFSAKLSGPTAVALSSTPIEARAGIIKVRFHCPDAPHPANVGLPNETRRLGVRLMTGWVFGHTWAWPSVVTRKKHFYLAPDEANLHEQVTANLGITPQDLLGKFESLGHSCDFGLVQREIGIEPLGLLRFAGIDNSKAVLGLMTDFDGLGAEGKIVPYTVEDQDEYWIHETAFDLHYHTFVSPKAAAPEQLIAREKQRLPFLRRKFLEDISNGEKIFLLRRPDLYDDSEALAVWAALNKTGDNTLLYLEQGDHEPPGTVREIGPGLLKGYINNRHGDVAPAVNVWLSVCANAYLAHRAEQIKKYGAYP